MFKILFSFLFSSILVFAAGPTQADDHPLMISKVNSELSFKMQSAATDLLRSMDSSQRREAMYAFNSKERTEWRYLPSPSKLTGWIFPDHSGLRTIRFNREQKEKFRQLLSVGLSASGLDAIDAALELEKNDSLKFRGWIDWLLFKYGPENYFISFFGQPNDSIWGWRFEGHHISLNFTMKADGTVSAQPTFIGTTLGTVMVGDKAVKVLDPVRTAAQNVVTSMDTKQMGMAKESMKKVPMFTQFTPGLFSKKLKLPTPLPPGLSFQAMSSYQQTQILQILVNYQSQFAPEIAQAALARVRAGGVENIEFIWAGDEKMEKPFYFRVQGRNFIYEFTCSEGHADHYHTVWLEI